jgi:hypothetical protein
MLWFEQDNNFEEHLTFFGKTSCSGKKKKLKLPAESSTHISHETRLFPRATSLGIPNKAANHRSKSQLDRGGIGAGPSVSCAMLDLTFKYMNHVMLCCNGTAIFLHSMIIFLPNLSMVHGMPPRLYAVPA